MSDPVPRVTPQNRGSAAVGRRHRIGVIGLGMMGASHLDIYAGREDVEVVAVSSRSPAKLAGEDRASGNIAGMAEHRFDVRAVKGYTDWRDLVADPAVEAVDICSPTPLHFEMAAAALEAGRHVMVEKPLARSAAEARELARLADKAWERRGLVAMTAMCMRFWPGWDWLKQAIDEGRYGPVRSASFQRLCEHTGSAFNRDGVACGGAILDLHIHDADFVRWCFGPPLAVTTGGYSAITGEPDHVCTRYHYGDDAEAPGLVFAEGGWVMATGFGFSMRYAVNFAEATAVFDLNADPVLRVCHGGRSEAVALDDTLGYAAELDAFLGCIREGRRPDRVTMREAAEAVALIEAEGLSLREGRTVSLEPSS